MAAHAEASTKHIFIIRFFSRFSRVLILSLTANAFLENRIPGFVLSGRHRQAEETTIEICTYSTVRRCRHLCVCTSVRQSFFIFDGSEHRLNALATIAKSIVVVKRHILLSTRLLRRRCILCDFYRSSRIVFASQQSWKLIRFCRLNRNVVIIYRIYNRASGAIIQSRLI